LVQQSGQAVKSLSPDPETLAGSGSRARIWELKPPLPEQGFCLWAFPEKLGRIRLLPADGVRPGLLPPAQQQTAETLRPALSTKLSALGASRSNELRVPSTPHTDKHFFSQLPELPRSFQGSSVSHWAPKSTEAVFFFVGNTDPVGPGSCRAWHGRDAPAAALPTARERNGLTIPLGTRSPRSSQPQA